LCGVRTSMNIVIAGGTGFLGRPLTAALVASGHQVTVLTRAATAGAARTMAWTPDGSANGVWPAVIDGSDVVINLAGESIAGKRWTPAQKARILESRVHATRSLVAAVERATRPPAVFVSGSAVGFYGPHQDQIITEQTAAGHDFLADVCVRWEKEASRLEGTATRVVYVRTGLVLERDGGALPQMLPPFWFGAGGPVGSGQQYWPWIHRDDWIELIQFLIATTTATGAVNATAPHPVTNREFASALGRALHRPAFMPAPGFALKLLLGEMADALLLSGQRAVPAKAESLGYTFRFKTLDDALRAIFNRQT
jgi:uncharacterized protein (TIGR01777 family)